MRGCSAALLYLISTPGGISCFQTGNNAIAPQLMKLTLTPAPENLFPLSSLGVSVFSLNWSFAFFFFYVNSILKKKCLIATCLATSSRGLQQNSLIFSILYETKAPVCMVFLFLNFKTDLYFFLCFKRQNDTEIFHLLVHSPNMCNSQNWVRPKAED